MSANDDGPYEALIAKLQRLRALSPDDLEAIRSLPLEIECERALRYLVKEGDQVTSCCVLLSGFACRSKLTRGGSRQILSFHIPGDILNLEHLLIETADHNVQVITDATFAWAPTASIREMIRAHPNLAEAFWQDTLIDASIFREWVLNVGQRTPARGSLTCCASLPQEQRRQDWDRRIALNCR